jgi:hypothetical protein
VAFRMSKLQGRQDAGAPDVIGACLRSTSRQDAGAPRVVAVAGKMPALQIAARGRIGLGEFLEDATLFSKPAETAGTTFQLEVPGQIRFSKSGDDNDADARI